MLRTVYLHGDLGRKFGWKHRFDVETLPEAVFALSANYPKFKPYFMRGPGYSFVKGATRREGQYLDLAELTMRLGQNDIHIIPAAYGNGGGDSGKSIGKIILGVVMIAGAFLTAGASLAASSALLAADIGVGVAGLGASAAAATGMGAAAFSLPLIGAISYGQIAATGFMMALGGVSSLLSATPQASGSNYSQMERPEARASFIYAGPANTTEQGGPVPVLYGQMRVGSLLVSGSVTSEDITEVATSGATAGVTSEVSNGY